MVAALVAVLVAGSVVVAVGLLALLGRLPPNSYAGIRTPYTRSSPENWYRTHRAGAPLLIFGGVAVVMAALAFLPFALAGKLADVLTAGVSLGAAALLAGCAVAAWLIGTRQSRLRP
ncbi:MAG: SdpI family protein [Dehalococcoidia bacterium]|nr:SdpI family protein [Dehalococcoidia bacterium]